MLPLWPFLFGGRAGDFSRGFIFEGPPRASGRHERTGGSEPFRYIACKREEDDDENVGSVLSDDQQPLQGGVRNFSNAVHLFTVKDLGEVSPSHLSS